LPKDTGVLLGVKGISDDSDGGVGTVGLSVDDDVDDAAVLNELVDVEFGIRDSTMGKGPIVWRMSEEFVVEIASTV